MHHAVPESRVSRHRALAHKRRSRDEVSRKRRRLNLGAYRQGSLLCQDNPLESPVGLPRLWGNALGYFYIVVRMYVGKLLERRNVSSRSR
jgi:hypothetical protein